MGVRGTSLILFALSLGVSGERGSDSSWPDILILRLEKSNAMLRVLSLLLGEE